MAGGKTLALAICLLAAPAFAQSEEDFEDFEDFSEEPAAVYDYAHVEQAAPVYGSESGCHGGASAQGYDYGASLAGSSVACDALRALEALDAADKRGEKWIGRLVRVNFLVRATVRPLLSVVTLGLL